MMNKIPSAQPALAKFLFLLPVVALLLLSFRSVQHPEGIKVNLDLPLVNGNGLNIYGQNNPASQKEPKNLVTWRVGDNKNVVLAIFQDGTQETYDLATEEGKQKMRAAQLFIGDTYSPEDTQRRWSAEFETF